MRQIDEIRGLLREFPTATWKEIDQIYLERHKADHQRLQDELRRKG